MSSIVTPPAAKRVKLGTETNGSPSKLPSPSPSKVNGHTSSAPLTAPAASSAPLLPVASTSALDPALIKEESDDEDEQEESHVKEEEDVSRRDMYLDTVRVLFSSF
jgi:U4/U6.U5 tri-snRNP-associated protein 2